MSIGIHGLNDIEGNFLVDEAVIEAMPNGTKVVSAEKYGDSAWTQTARISARLPNGEPKAYFLKCANEDNGRTMLFGKFTSVTAIQTLLPGLVPAPEGWGKFKRRPPGAPETYFFLSDFIDMNNSAPEPIQFTTRVAELHHKGTSPNGMFGFPVVVCDGRLPQPVGWECNWATFFAKLIRGVLKLDIETNGPWPELEAAAEQIITQVIPRLCGVLQTEGRHIKASLIHGDLWEGNVGTRADNGDIVLYDAGSYYAHNEMDLGQWRCEWGQYLRSNVYLKHYLRNFEAADPVDEWEDRNRLYSLKYNLNYSAGHPGSVTRHTAYNDMCYLCEKYAPLVSLGRYDPAKDPSITGPRTQVHIVMDILQANGRLHTPRTDSVSDEERSR